MLETMALKINIDEPRYDQSTYWGRAKHFFSITNPLNLLASSKDLDEAKTIVTKYRKGDSLAGLTEDQLWRAKELYDSAFHPDTGEKMILIGRMSAQVPMNMTITGLMMTFYKSTPAVVFWQWANQSFNALVNYTNRSGSSSISNEQLLLCYAMGTGGALGTALSLNRLTKHARPLIGRLVPFAAVAAANCINVPMMRLTEIQQGIPVTDKSGKELGLSKTAAKQGIAIVTFSRIAMASPGMALTPVLMNFLESKGTLARYPWCGPPIQIAVLGLCLTFATPMCCAIFSQKMEKAVSDLEPELQAKINAMPNPPQEVYYNKGL